MWQLIFTKKARKDLLSLEKQVVKRIISKLEKTADNPKQHYSKVVDSPYCKLRVGDYRVIVVLESRGKLVDVRRIGHRRNIYKKI